MSVYRNKSGFFEVDFKLRGKRLHRCTEARTEAEARDIEKQLKAQLQKDIAHEEITGNAPLTLTEACYLYWEQRGKDHASAKDTWRCFQFILKTLGKNIRLDQITDAHIIKLIEKRRKLPRWGRKTKSENKPVSNATINRDVTEVLRRLFNRAKRAWKCQLPIEPDWHSHILPEPQERVRELDGHEAQALDAAGREDYALWYRFSRITGLRRAETLIKWSNVNFSAGLITLPGKRGRMVKTPITPAVASILDQCRGNDPVFVFTYVAQRTAKGKIRGKRYPITYSGCKTEWRRQKERAGVEDCRYHDLRHDLATKLLRSTGNLKVVQKALNHSSLTMTAKYAHVADSDLSDAMEKFQATMPESPKKLPKPTDEAA